MAYYDEITGNWIETGGAGFDQLDNSSGTDDLSDWEYIYSGNNVWTSFGLGHH
jgi:hypothetical protein